MVEYKIYALVPINSIVSYDTEVESIPYIYSYIIRYIYLNQCIESIKLQAFEFIDKNRYIIYAENLDVLNKSLNLVILFVNFLSLIKEI
jgi:hypothetical protein